MHKEMIHIFFLLQTHRASIWTAKLSSLSLPSIGILPLDAAQAKKQTFGRVLDLQMDLVATS